MSAPVCLRSAFGACRPSKVSEEYKSRSEPAIKGIPKTSSKEEQKKVLDQIPEKTPPKRPNPPASIITDTPSAATVNTTSAQDAATLAGAAASKDSKPATPKLIPGNVIAAYRTPLKHPAPYGVPVASLQLRSYSVRSLEFFADFALRAAYYLNLPATGPVPLPKRIERWTMPRSNFIHKKSQENFERITYRRLVTVMDGDKTAVEVWLAVLRKWQFYGVGMKANVWEWESLDVGAKMDTQAKELETQIEAQLASFGWNKSVADKKSLDEMLRAQGVKHVGVPVMDVREGSRRANPEI